MQYVAMEYLWQNICIYGNRTGVSPITRNLETGFHDGYKTLGGYGANSLQIDGDTL